MNRPVFSSALCESWKRDSVLLEIPDIRKVTALNLVLQVADQREVAHVAARHGSRIADCHQKIRESIFKHLREPCDKRVPRCKRRILQKKRRSLNTNKRLRRLFHDISHSIQVCEHIHTWESDSLTVKPMVFQVRVISRTWKSGSFGPLDLQP